jgi:cell pole-organizing protein PopZ
MSAPSVKANEPSMEEILASIRRIISDDQKPEPTAAAPTPAASPQPSPAPAIEIAPEPEDVLDLATVAPQSSSGMADDDVEFREIDEPPSMASVEAELPAPARPAPPVREGPRPAPSMREAGADQLLSPQADAAVSHAFNALTSTILTSNARTLEDLVKDMMRPMLKVWLDDNLPALVERLVRTEIERVTRGPRG